MTMLSVASLAAGHGPLPDWAHSNWPRFSETEIAAVVDVLRSGRVNALQHGDRCRAFERAFAELCDMPHAIALSNGTVALELALRALEIGPGDEVIVTPRTFVASANCIVTCGATPVFADVDPVSQNITAASIARVLTSRTRAILPVHLAGWPCEMDEIMTLARARNLKVIEDCAQAHGASYHGRPIGSFGDAAAFSFCTDKIISTGGEGGMLLLRDHAVWAKAWAYKDHGKSHAAVSEPAAGRSFRWLHESVGSNYRMTEMQAAIGLEQLARLPEWLRARRRNADVLNDLLGGLPALRLTLPPAGVGHAYYKYYAFVRPERLREGWSRDRIVDEAAESGVACGSGSCPEVYRERAFVDAGLAPPARLANARLLGETSLMLPVDHTLDEAAMREIGLRLRTVALSAGVDS
jgi:dTDP-4-amino-4,6-dideoxygalactose transaminase